MRAVIGTHASDPRGTVRAFSGGRWTRAPDGHTNTAEPWNHRLLRVRQTSMRGARVSRALRNVFDPNQLEACLGIVATKSPSGKLATEQATVAGGRDAAQG